MPAAFLDQLPVQFEMAGYVARGTQEWGDMSVACESVSGDAVAFDPTPLFEGLPDNRCQAHHWGYLIEGRMEYDLGDRTETIEAGQVYYIPAGHIPRTLEPTRGVEFTRTDELNQTIEVVQRNTRRMFGDGEGS